MVFLFIVVGTLLPLYGYSQSEEDILNSIGAELESEQDKKEALEKKEKEYERLKPKADGYMKGEKYDKARETFKLMADIFPDRDYPKRQIKLANQLEAKAKREVKQGEYDQLMADADGEMSKEKYAEAKAIYQQALKIFPEEQLPKEKIKLAVKKTEEREAAKREAELKAKYTEKVKEADKAFADQKWEEANQLYKAALSIKSDETYPTQQLKLIKQKKEEEAERKKQEALDKQYQTIIDQADDLLKNQKWDAAKEKYTAAGKLKPNESYPNEKIAEAEKLQKEEAERLAQEALDKKYNRIIEQADDFLKNENWDDAIAKYEEAKSTKPNESYPTEQIAAANQAKDAAAQAAEQAKLQSQYDALTKGADNLLNAQNFDQAIAKYQEAQKVLPNETYPKDRIAEAEKQKAAKAQEAVQAEYDALIKKADQLLQAGSYDESIKEYETAKAVLPSESYPQEQIAEANRLKADAQAAEAQRKKQKEFDAIIAQADQLFNSGDLEGSIGKYQEAQLILPENKYPQEQIAKANAEIEKLNAKKQAAEELEAKYTAAMENGNAALTNEKWEEAIGSFKEALELKKGDASAQENLQTAEFGLEKLKAKLEADERAAEEAAELRKEFDALITKADAEMASEDYTSAISIYKQAQKILPDETLPGQKITEAENAIKQKEQALAEDKAAEAAKKQELEKKFKDLLVQGDAAKDSEQFQEAISIYQEAKELKPTAEAPDAKIEEVNTLISQKEEAQRLAQEKQEAQEESQAEFNAKLEAGNAALEKGEFTEAISIFQQAKSIDSKSSLPNEGIAEAEKGIQAEAEALAEERKAEAEKKNQAEKQFQDLLAQGEDAKNAGQLEAAISLYERAKALKPAAETPQVKIEEINTLLAQKQEAERLAAEKRAAEEEKDKEFNALINRGNAALDNNQFTEAISIFNQAKSMDPESTIPDLRIAKVEEKMKAAEEAEAEAEAAEQARLEEVEEEYSSLIGEAEALVQQKIYPEAIAKFEEAQEVKPTAMGPKERIDHVKRLMRKEEEEKQKAKDAALAKLKLEKGFEDALADGDAALASKEFVAAKNAYQRAQQLKLDSPVPAQKIEKADQLQQEWEKVEAERKAKAEAERKAAAKAKAEAEQAQKAYNDAIAQADKFFNAREYDQAAAGYIQAAEMKPEMEYPKSQLEEIKRLKEDRAKNLAKKAAQEAAAKREAERARKEKQKAKKEAENRADKARQNRMKRYQELQPEALAAKFPSGISHEEYDDGQRMVKKSTIVENGVGRQLMRYKYPWGAEFFFLNGKQITKDAYYWDMRKYR